MHPPNFHCSMNIHSVGYSLFKITPLSRTFYVSQYGNLQSSMTRSLSYFSVLWQCTVRRNVWRIRRLVNKGGVGLNNKHALKNVQTEREKRENYLP